VSHYCSRTTRRTGGAARLRAATSGMLLLPSLQDQQTLSSADILSTSLPDSIRPSMMNRLMRRS